MNSVYIGEETISKAKRLASQKVSLYDLIVPGGYKYWDLALQIGGVSNLRQ
jgi:hypothetical protein